MPTLKRKRIKLFMQGKSPKEIKRDENKGGRTTTIAAVLSTLERAKEISKSEVLLRVDPQTRQEVFGLIKGYHHDDLKHLDSLRILCSDAGLEVDADDLEILHRYRGDHIRYGDLYEVSRIIELYLHRQIREALVNKFGDAWFDEGISQKLSKNILQHVGKTENMSQSDKFANTTVTHLIKILQSDSCPASLTNQFSLFWDAKKRRYTRLWDFKDIRDKIMHPIRKTPTLEDYEQLKQLMADLGLAH
jgi:hypothetical protein